MNSLPTGGRAKRPAAKPQAKYCVAVAATGRSPPAVQGAKNTAKTPQNPQAGLGAE